MLPLLPSPPPPYRYLMLLRHIHLPSPTSYVVASELQHRLVSQFLAHKASPDVLPPPTPTVITASFNPVYTCGRRELGTVTSEQREHLTQRTEWGQAEFFEALRGGQTTFHGPGQLIAYPIIDLKRHGLNPRCYVRVLESSVISLLGQQYGIKAFTTENPGVWVNSTSAAAVTSSVSTTAQFTTMTPHSESKICALGIHLRRNISSHGIGLNVSTELGWFKRIVACGLEGKGTTSIAECQGRKVEGDVERVADEFVQVLAGALQGVEKVEKVEDVD